MSYEGPSPILARLHTLQVFIVVLIMLKASSRLHLGTRPAAVGRAPRSLCGHHPLVRGPQQQRMGVRMSSFLPDAVEDVLTTGTLVASGLAILGTAALAARSPSRPKQSSESFDSDISSFGVMTVVSCIPLVNWTAWVLPAITQPERSSLYFAYAFLYAVPLLLEGFDIETYTVALLLLGALHVQVERIAATEPETFRNIKPLSGLLSVAGFFAEKAVTFTQSLFGVVASDTKQIIRGPDADPDLLDGPKGAAERSGEEVELLEFDRRLIERDAAKRRKSQRKE